jgi:hypothetical protein
MRAEIIQVPPKGTYKWQLFTHWTDEFRQTQADHVAYIALHLAGVLDPCRSKLQKLLAHHAKQLRTSSTRQAQRHERAIEKLHNTMTGAAISYEQSFQPH